MELTFFPPAHMHRSPRDAPTLLPTSTSRGGAPAPLRYSGELSELLSMAPSTVAARDQLAEIFHDAPQISPAHMSCTFQHGMFCLTHSMQRVRRRRLRWSAAPSASAKRLDASKHTRTWCQLCDRVSSLQKKVCCKAVLPLGMLATCTPAKAQQHDRAHTHARRQNA